MFVVTLKTGIKRPKRTIILGVFALLLIVGIIYVITDSSKSTASCKGIGEYSLKFATDREKEEFLSAFNLNGEQVTIDKVKIPETFNATYEKYNTIQKKIGLDLDPYRGKTVKRFVYSTKDNLFVSVLVYGNRVVGGHKCTNVYGDDFKSLADGIT
ncbi:MAG: DUF4830 domain-containing protein [Oscillospiraceae bacterium]|nr:DUF4830 domain-containing protein [Oscillospiraceae bacterium]